MALGARLAKRISALGMSQSELARRSGVPQTTVNSIIKEDRRSSPHLMRLAIALKTTPGYLLGETEDPSSQVAEAALSYEEQIFFEQLRLLSREDFELVAQLVDRLREGRPSYVFRQEDDEVAATVHDRQREYKPGEAGPKWGD